MSMKKATTTNMTNCHQCSKQLNKNEEAYYVDLDKDGNRLWFCLLGKCHLEGLDYCKPMPNYMSWRKLLSQYRISEMPIEEQVDFLFDFFTWKEQENEIAARFLQGDFWKYLELMSEEREDEHC